MMNYIERSGSWTDRKQLVEGYLNNMGAAYGDDDNWGVAEKGLFAAALQQTDLVVQPRQSNTWGPVSLDHVYEFTGGLSLAVKTLTGKEPDALMADYRNRANRRMQDLNEAIAVEVRTTVLNPAFVKELDFVDLQIVVLADNLRTAELVVLVGSLVLEGEGLH